MQPRSPGQGEGQAEGRSPGECPRQWTSLDITLPQEANQRTSLLALEIDEQSAVREKRGREELMEVEARCAEQVGILLPLLSSS